MMNLPYKERPKTFCWFSKKH